ncbi:MerR family transcriptional regulator [Listeria booriae]|uniref:MerR family transcriptional regulator n=1 Tax=Listeria booriae TaxID=1552123 RepID=UPI001625F999|nr:MerR family transcriptional regulator [Listeria booriae]MBC2194400.1 MerR family transcriptional regulator [Listeria booriae]
MKGHELSEKLGIPVSTLHYYEKQGLIKPKRSENQYRIYTEHDIKLLKYILILKEAGFTLTEIKQVIYRYFHQEHDANCRADAHHFFNQKIEELQQKIARYTNIIQIMEDLPVMLGEENSQDIQAKNDVLVDAFFEQKEGK